MSGKAEEEPLRAACRRLYAGNGATVGRLKRDSVEIRRLEGKREGSHN